MKAGSSNSGFTTAGSVISGTSIPSTVTHFIITNKTGSPVTIGVQCQLPGALVQDGCTTNISDIAILDLTSGTQLLSRSPPLVRDRALSP